MLEQKDLELLKSMMETVVSDSEKRTAASISQSEKMLLDEMYRLHSQTEKRFDKMDRRLDRMEFRMEAMQHDINANKLEAGAVDLLIRRLDNLEDRIDALEDKSDTPA